MKRPTLRVVPYDPNDYSLGEALVRENHELVKEESFIQAALSLYFQWPEYRLCRASIAGNPKVIDCELDYDREERSPTELKLSFSETANSGFDASVTQITLRFQIFGNCYEFDARILARSEHPSEDGWNSIVSIPASLLVCKHRRSRRIYVDSPVAIDWSESRQEPRKRISVVEIGATSMRVQGDMATDTVGLVYFGEKAFSFKVLRVDGNERVLGLMFDNGHTAGEFFEQYASFAFPSLRPRSALSNGAILELYLQANYVSKFVDRAGENRSLSELFETWDALSTATDVSADYVSVDENNQPTGASGIAIAFEHDRQQVWAFHQLCALTRPNLLEQSGQLYAWRAEFLVGRPEALDVIGWFDSRSRWLERIYVKFAAQKPGYAESVSAVSVTKITFKSESKSTSEATLLPMGTTRRWLASDGDALGGSQPALLNASSALEAIVDVSKETDWKKITSVGQTLARASGEECLTLEVTTTHRESLPEGAKDEDRVTSVDRYFRFSKGGLLDFLASVEHSVAVTIKKKLKHGPDSPAL